MGSTIQALNEQNAAQMRGSILALEAAMFDMKELIIDLPVKHHFAPGIYMRELFIPKGTTLTGLIHKTEHMCVLSHGRISVWTDQGMRDLTASSVVHSMPGIKRVIYAHEDSTWINVHYNPTNEQDPEIIESIFTVKSFEDLQLFNETKKELE
jgi:quercetin dioxygenase-like cupin family protein